MSARCGSGAALRAGGLLALALALSQAGSCRADEGAASSGSGAPAAPAVSAATGDASNREAIERFEAYLVKYPDSDSRPDVLFTLGQLHEEAETARAMAASENADQNPDVVPHPDAIRCYAEVVDSFPKFPQRDAVLYRLGVVLMEAGESPAAERRLGALIEETPEGRFAGPARLRLAELAEARGAWAAAAKFYDQALTSGVDPHREKLYYRRGWSQYKSADESGAVATLRRGIALEESLKSDPDVGFFRESITLLASIEAGAAAGSGWEEITAGMREPATRRRFLAELGTQLEEGDRSLAALPVLDRAVAEGPDHPEAPLAAHSAIRAADKALAGASAKSGGAERSGAKRATGASATPPPVAPGEPVARRLSFEERYARDGAWRAQVTLPPEETQRIEEMCEESLYGAGLLQYDASRRDTTDAAAAASAEATLRRAVERYPNSESRNDAGFLIGELARGAADWHAASAAYERTDPRALTKERKEALLYGRILAREGIRVETVAAQGEESDAARAAARSTGEAIDLYLAEFPQAPAIESLRRKRAELLAQAGDPAAAADRFRILYEQAPLGTKDTRELAGLAAVNTARAGQYEEAAAWYDKANDPERAAAAVYEAAQRAAAAGDPKGAGLLLLELRARYPEVAIAGAAALDAIEHFARAEATDTLLAWAATLPAPAPASAGGGKAAAASAAPAEVSAPGDSLQRAFAAAARRTLPRDPVAAGRLFQQAARFGAAEGANEALVASGEAFLSAGRREDAAVALSAGVVRFPRDASSVPPTLFAADILADSLGDPARASALLAQAATAAKAATPGRAAAWRRRTGHALAKGGKPAEAQTAFDLCLADTALAASGKIALAGPDSALFERETALAALEKGDLLRAALPAPATKKMAAAESKKLQAKTDETVAAYAYVVSRGFRDLTSRAGHDAGEALALSASAFLEASIAGRDAALFESARRSASRAVAFRAATAALPVTPPDEWMTRAAAGLDLRRRLGARLLAAGDSLAPSADATGLKEKAISERIVALDRLAEYLAGGRTLALDDSSADLEAQVALARGGYVERMATLLAAAPLPANLSPETEGEYRKAIGAKAGEFNDRAAGIYREALDHAGASGARGAPVAELEQRLALLTAGGRGD